MKIRVGFGFDVHQLKDGLDFWLGGIIVPHTKGGVGHSDADVLIHAICDAILGAAGIGDIGTHFPDTDPQYKGIDSKILLKEVMEKVNKRGFFIGNIDATICLEKPKLKPHIPSMQQTMAGILNMKTDDLSIKATTSEKMGFVGREDGVAAYAVVLIQK